MKRLETLATALSNTRDVEMDKGIAVSPGALHSRLVRLLSCWHTREVAVDTIYDKAGRVIDGSYKMAQYIPGLSTTVSPQS